MEHSWSSRIDNADWLAPLVSGNCYRMAFGLRVPLACEYAPLGYDAMERQPVLFKECPYCIGYYNPCPVHISTHQAMPLL